MLHKLSGHSRNEGALYPSWQRRSGKGTIMTWLLILAIIGLTLVLGVIFLELLIRWVSLARVQTAAKEASLVYARDMVRLRDNCLSLANSKDLTLQSAGIAESCDATGGGACPCTPLKGQAASIPGALTMEYLNASQTLLYNIWGKRIADPKEVDNVQQSQCYKPYSDQRFSKIQSPEPTCTVTGKVTSPITDLKWEFKANPYGTGLCCATGGANDNAKDFCVDVRVTGRMDPIMAGGLPFLSAKGIFDPAASAANGRSPMKPVRFITIGDFEIHARAVVNKMSSKESTGDDSLTQNLSGETIQLEDIPKGATCASAPTVVPITPNPLTPPTPGALSLPPLPPLPPSEIDPTAPPIDPGLDPTPPVVPNCPYGFSLGNIINRSSLAVDYICNPCPAAGSIQSQGAQTCSGNSVVRSDSMNNGNCGTYPQTVTVAACGNGCSNGACSPPPPPAPVAVAPVTPPASGCVYKITSGLYVGAYDDFNKKNVATGQTGFETAFGSKGSLMGVEIRSIDKGFQDFINQNCTSKASSFRSESTDLSAYKNADPQVLAAIAWKECTTRKNFFGTAMNDASSKYIDPTERGLEYRTLYADSNGNIIGSSPGAGNICGSMKTVSPISLILSEEATSFSVSQFNLISSVDSSKWYRWKASSSRPLLVYDPMHKGQITSASQLFGNYTFSKQWSNGYEALATLDKNLDGNISAHELKDLALWFDENKNGISEKGEVKRLSEVGITKLFFKANKTDLKTGDIHASIGYERCMKGKCSVGASVDWYGEGPFDTKEEALLGKSFVAGLGFVKTEKYFVGRN